MKLYWHNSKHIQSLKLFNLKVNSKLKTWNLLRSKKKINLLQNSKEPQMSTTMQLKHFRISIMKKPRNKRTNIMLKWIDRKMKWSQLKPKLIKSIKISNRKKNRKLRPFKIKWEMKQISPLQNFRKFKIRWESKKMRLMLYLKELLMIIIVKLKRSKISTMTNSRSRTKDVMLS